MLKDINNQKIKLLELTKDEKEELYVTATQSIEELAPYKATAHACTIGMSMDSDTKMRSRR